MKQSTRADEKGIGRPLTDQRMVFRLNRFLQNNKVVFVLSIGIFSFVFLGCNYIKNMIVTLFDCMTTKAPITTWNQAFAFKQIIVFSMTHWGFYLVVILFCAVLIGFFIYNIKIGYGEMNYGQKGSERWATLAELEEQYIAIPEKDESFPGWGGVPICRTVDKDGNKKILIDAQKTINTLLLGMTRSGKGELYSFPMIDILSRAELKSSMVITDPKLELATSSIPQLRKMGYECHVLNLINPLESMGYNPLSIIAQAYQEGDIMSAETMSVFLSNMIYYNVKATDPFWNDSAGTALVAMILAHIDDAIKLDALENAKKSTALENRKRNYAKLTKENKQKFAPILKANRTQEEVDALVAKHKTQIFMLERQPMKGTLSGRRHQAHQIATLQTTIKNLQKEIMIQKKYALPDEIYVPSNTNQKAITLYSICVVFSDLARQKIGQKGRTMLDEYFGNRPAKDRAKLQYAAIELSPSRGRSSIFMVALEKLRLFVSDSVAQLTAENTLDLKAIGFGDKPIAVFIGVPDYDKSMYFIVSLFVRQLYYVLSRELTISGSGMCPRRVSFILDEFGNTPPIENMDNIISVCLGRNMQFTLIIQDYAQLQKLYGEDSSTIKTNCGNHIYLKSGMGSAAEEFSKSLGDETIVDFSRDGHKMALKKHFHESTSSRPLMTAQELGRLNDGEVVINRYMKTTDLKGNDIDSYPIYAHGPSRLVFRHEYLDAYTPTKAIAYADLPDIERRDEVQLNVLDYMIILKCFQDAYDGNQMMTRKRPQIADLSKDDREFLLMHLLSLYKTFDVALEQYLSDVIINLELNHKDQYKHPLLMTMYKTMLPYIENF